MRTPVSHCILFGPLLGTVIVFGHVRLVEPRDLRDEGVVRVGVT